MHLWIDSNSLAFCRALFKYDFLLDSPPYSYLSGVFTAPPLGTYFLIYFVSPLTSPTPDVNACSLRRKVPVCQARGRYFIHLNEKWLERQMKMDILSPSLKTAEGVSDGVRPGLFSIPESWCLEYGKIGSRRWLRGKSTGCASMGTWIRTPSHAHTHMSLPVHFSEDTGRFSEALGS